MFNKKKKIRNEELERIAGKRKIKNEKKRLRKKDGEDLETRKEFCRTVWNFNECVKFEKMGEDFRKLVQVRKWSVYIKGQKKCSTSTYGKSVVTLSRLELCDQ